MSVTGGSMLGPPDPAGSGVLVLAQSLTGQVCQGRTWGGGSLSSSKDSLFPC